MEIPLGGLSPQAVAAYVAQRRGTPAGHEAVAAFVYRRTEGHPLFMVQVMDYLEQHGMLQAGVADALGDTVVRELPQGLQQLIAAQVGQLGAEAQQVLEAGSVAGAEFVVASVAAGVQMAPAAVEAVCERLAQQGQFLDDRGVEEWPDGTVNGRYGWRHALYQEVVYQRLGAGHRARLHRRIGEREAAGYGAHASERAAELAVHFERGQDYPRAVQYLGQAADNAAQRHAPHEVIALLTRALALLAHLPATLTRAQQELAFQMSLGPAWMVTKGQAAPEVEQTYTRARALCAQVGDTPQLFPTLWGLYRFYLGRGALSTAHELAEELAQRATRAADVTARLEAHEARGTTVFYLGDYATARTHFAQAMALPAPTAQQTLVLRRDGGPGVRCLAMGATALWCLGWPGQAVRRSLEALALAQELAHPYSLAVAHYWALALHHHRREAAAVLAHADTLLTLAHAQGFALHVGYGTCLQGWARVMQGQRPAGLGQLRQGLVDVLATGLELQRPFGLLLLAEAVGAGGQVAEGLRLLAEARTVLEATGQGDLLAEVYRLQGAFLLCQAVPNVPQAEACFHQALTIARRQQAKSWELRTAMSLSRLWQQQGKRDAARELLAPLYGWFTEGFDTADLQEAKALLEALT